MPVGSAPLRGQVEGIPYRPDKVDMSWILSLFRRGVEKLRAIKKLDLILAPLKDIDRRYLSALFALGEVVLL
jgi:hypothetical protein